MDACEECGFVYDTPTDEIPTRLRALAAPYRSILKSTSDDRLRTHPAAGVWSPLEYGCHMRDVFRSQLGKLLLMLKEDRPRLPSMRREERVAEERYNEQTPATVAFELAVAADELATALERLEPAQWEREGLYSYPTPTMRTVEWVGNHTIHEGAHHIMDIERQLGNG